ncbi:C6 zinc finger protein [Colletotrichum asianum]
MHGKLAMARGSKDVRKVNETQNPFRLHVLPLAHQHVGVLHAVLGLAACHMTLSPYGVEQVDMATALQHRVAALNALSSLLIKEEIYGLAAAEEDAVLAIILLLVLHDKLFAYVSWLTRKHDQASTPWLVALPPFSIA